jgi:hypothetical protein
MMPDNHTSDDSDARIPEREVGLNLLVPRINVIYTKKNLSPPFHLRAAVEYWLSALTPDEIIDLVERPSRVIP